jgi:two-component system NarL family sensor kinase
MKLRYKIILFAIVPLLLSVLAIAAAMFHQTSLLAQQQRSTVEQAYMASKEAELKHYVTLGLAAISDLYRSGPPTPEKMEAAKAILAKLDYGNDGYFYIYDMQGRNLMHPRQPELVGRDLWNMADPEGQPTIQNLINKAKQGGGVVRYLWERPSTRKVAPKLGYVVALERWGWMLGTGIYLDDVDAALNKIDVQVAKNTRSTMLWLAAIATASALLVALSGLALNISESRVAEAKLKVLAQSVVKSQEDERARLSRDLHDGLSQLLVSIKLQIESGLAKLTALGAQLQVEQAGQADQAKTPLVRATSQLNDALSEVRRISHDLRPPMLDDLGLAAAFEQLASEFAGATALPVHFEASGETAGLSQVGNTVLFRVAQEALTNIHKHATEVSTVSLLLSGDARQVQLVIRDDGAGFDVAGVASNPRRGIGLSNMKERLDAVRGTLQVLSGAQGTQVTASIPRGAIA